MNCRNIRREIEAAGPGDVLSSRVDQHLANCTACETLARQQANLHRIVSSLGTVEASGDFDFRLRARLAADKRQPRPFALAGLSFGVRAAATAMVLILFGAAVLFVALRTRSGNSAPEVVAGGAPNVNQANPSGGNVPAPVPAPGKVEQPQVPAPTVVAGSKTPQPSSGKRRGTSMSTVATYRDGRTSYGGTRDSSGTGAVVLKGNEGVAFPIDASYQSLKVSIDNGRGSSRTISLPTVSFGSQRALSQDATPLMASARGAW
jgi:hypothetical protein